MEHLLREATYNSPKVDFNPSTGELLIEGRSIPEHANLFYNDLIEWTRRYAESLPEKTVMSIKVDYLNSSSHKFLLEVFEKLETLVKQEKSICVNWYYEEDDEEMKETGNEYKSTLNLPFNIIEVEEL